MHTLPVYSQAGEPTGESFSLDLAKIADGVNKVLLHDAVVMYQANLRVGTAKTKTRAEVSGSGKKMYKQKGTGNARMGNKRTPVRRGGGHQGGSCGTPPSVPSVRRSRRRGSSCSWKRSPRS